MTARRTTAHPGQTAWWDPVPSAPIRTEHRDPPLRRACDALLVAYRSGEGDGDAGAWCMAMADAVRALDATSAHAAVGIRDLLRRLDDRDWDQVDPRRRSHLAATQAALVEAIEGSGDGSDVR